MVAIKAEYQWLARCRVQCVFMFRSRDFALRSEYFDALAEIGLFGAS